MGSEGIRHVAQEEPNGCVAATLAMVIGVGYQTATTILADRKHDSREPPEKLGELVDLLVGEVRFEECADRAHVAARSGLELGRAGICELRVGDAEIRRARDPFHQPRTLESFEEPRDSGRRQREAARQIDALEPPPLRAREEVQRLVRVHRDAVLGLELRVQDTRRRGVSAQESRPRAHCGRNVR